MLLAKRPPQGATPTRSQRLPGHLDDVVGVAEALATHMDAFCTAMGIPAGRAPDLQRILPHAAWLHDLGKASAHFQAMIQGVPGRQYPQMLRHEAVSVLLVLLNPVLDTWLFAGWSPTDRDLALLAVIGHHLKAPDLSAFRPSSGAPASLQVLTDDPDFAAALAIADVRFGLGAPPTVAPFTLDDFDDQWHRLATSWGRTIMDQYDRWRITDPDQCKVLSLLRALVIAADGAGSAMPVLDGQDPESWAHIALGVHLEENQAQKVATQRLGSAPPRPFQLDVARSTAPVTLVEAGCGTGKTAGAWLWAGTTGRPRVVFCYPTTGTATQGWQDYPGEDLAALQHSRALADMDLDLATLESTGEVSPLEEALVLRSLRTWTFPVTVGTAHSVLGTVQHHRTGLTMLPAVLESAIVFDEIHQYDDALFGALLRWIDATPGIPTLLMTASLQPERRAQLAERLGPRLAAVQGPPDVESLPRYVITWGTPDRWQDIGAHLQAGGKVLRVCNTVNRAIEEAATAQAQGWKPILYHSRYRYRDRRTIHQQVVDAFSARSTQPVLAITTQVCEVSLDISASLLVTDLAPVPALVQRLGRLNRWGAEGSAPAPAVVVPVERPLPYAPDELEQARRWLASLTGRPVSQADLAANVPASSTDPSDDSLYSEWLDSPWAKARPVTEGDRSIPVIAREDLERIDARLGQGTHLSRRAERTRRVIEMTVPMPLNDVARQVASWDRLAGAVVAPPGRLVFDEHGGHWT